MQHVSPKRARVRRAIVGSMMAVALVSTASCDSDANDMPDTPVADGEDAIPSPEVEFFTDGDFQDIPKPRGATEASDKTERDGVITQSFTVTATGPRQIMTFYVDNLPPLGWELVDPVTRTGPNTERAAWVRDERRLEVSTGPVPGIEDERAQFSLVLLPDQVPGRTLNED